MKDKIKENNRPFTESEDPVEDSIDFVGRHYRKEAFPEREVWRRLRVRPLAWWRRGRNIAAITVGVTLTAAASVMIYNHTQENQSQPVPTEQTAAPASVSATSLLEVRRIEFSDAPLPSVVAEIERVYGVKVTGGENDSIRVSLSYEGNVTELLETINSLFGTQLAVEALPADSQPDKR